MARSRNIKPNFFKNEYLAELEPHTRLLFIGLWCLADREGYLEDRPKRIKGELFPYEQVDVDKLLQDLHDLEFILRYEVDGKKYICIPKFLEHQNPHKKEATSEIPKPSKSTGISDASTDLDTDEHTSSRADSLLLIPDSLLLIPDSLLLIADYPSTEPAAAENPFTFYQMNFGVSSPYITENIQKWCEDLSDIAVIEAMKIALEKNVKNWKFINKILNEWHVKGIKTLEAIKAERSEFERQKEANGQARSSPGRNKYAMQDKLPESVQRQLEREQQGKKETAPPTTVMDDPELKALLDGLRDVQAGVR